MRDKLIMLLLFFLCILVTGCQKNKEYNKNSNYTSSLVIQSIDDLKKMSIDINYNEEFDNGLYSLEDEEAENQEPNVYLFETSSSIYHFPKRLFSMQQCCQYIYNSEQYISYLDELLFDFKQQLAGKYKFYFEYRSETDMPYAKYGKIYLYNIEKYPQNNLKYTALGIIGKSDLYWMEEGLSSYLASTYTNNDNSESINRIHLAAKAGEGDLTSFVLEGINVNTLGYSPYQRELSMLFSESLVTYMIENYGLDKVVNCYKNADKLDDKLDGKLLSEVIEEWKIYLSKLKEVEYKQDFLDEIIDYVEPSPVIKTPILTDSNLLNEIKSLDELAKIPEIIDAEYLDIDYEILKKDYGYNFSVQELVTYRIKYKSDNCEVVGYITAPSDYLEKKYPIVIYNRGGFMYETLKLQEEDWHTLFAAYGMIVLTTQYRGYDGGTGIDEFGGAEINDVIKLIDIANTFTFSNNEQIFMIGASRGGLMTYLSCRLDSRIKAAVVLSGISNLFDPVYVNDQLLYKTLSGSTYGVPIEYMNRSAIYWADELNIPILIVHGTADRNVLVNQAYYIDSKFSEYKKDYELHIYEGLDHNLNPKAYNDTVEWLLNYIE